jgi:TnpA family transposase
VRRRYLTADVARAMATEIANAAFAARARNVWGAGSTAVASGSTHLGAFDQNIFAEWHSRYGTGTRYADLNSSRSLASRRRGSGTRKRDTGLIRIAL